MIELEFYADGIVEKPDVIGAVFGQTEGLLGQDLDLRELQRTGRIGRIDVYLKEQNGKTKGRIIVPSSLGLSETALIAAALETIERIGPCVAKIRVRSIRDIRAIKREYVMRRARDLLRKFLESEVPDSSWLVEKLKESVRTAELTTYRGLPAGPDVGVSDEIILVEGRADVMNLLRYGIRNVIAIGGTSIPSKIKDIAKEKITTVFVDGDRGGDLIVRELLQIADIDYVAKSPEGKEVEELTKKEVFKCLREKVPVDQYLEELNKKSVDDKIVEFGKRKMEEIFGTRSVEVFDKQLESIGRVPNNNTEEFKNLLQNGYLVVIDGVLTKEMADIINRSSVDYVFCKKIDNNAIFACKVIEVG